MCCVCCMYAYLCSLLRVFSFLARTFVVILSASGHPWCSPYGIADAERSWAVGRGAVRTSMSSYSSLSSSSSSSPSLTYSGSSTGSAAFLDMSELGLPCAGKLNGGACGGA